MQLRKFITVVAGYFLLLAGQAQTKSENLFYIKDQQGKTIEYKKDGDAIVFETKRNALYSIMIK